jgi:putative FmdB family regulatory protein
VPTYEYLCSACGNQWEEIQKISDAPLETCPKCGKPTAKRQISAGNFILKGGGWYADLYSSSKGPKASGGDTSASTTPASTSTTSTESAPKADAPKADTATKSDSGTKPAA